MISFLISVAAGVAAWTLLEYVLHRWLGHDARTRPNPFAAEHVRHHSEGNYFAPAWKKAAAAIVVVLVLSGPSIALAGSRVGLSFVASFVGMYVLYEVLHRRDHTHPGRSSYGRRLRRHHFHHHFVDPSANHGVTSPVWDWVFGTLREPGVIPVPRKLAMPWLLDPDTGEVRPAHREGYEVYGGSRAAAPGRAAEA